MNLKLEKNKWYAWQMLPGYNEERYISPIKILDVDRSKGTDTIGLHFYNACYANGEKDFYYELKILAHSKECLISKIITTEKNNPISMAIIEEVDYQWLKKNITIEKIDINTEVSGYLNRHYQQG